MGRGKRLVHFLTSVLLVIGPVATSADEHVVVVRDRRSPSSSYTTTSSGPSYFSSLASKYVPSSLSKGKYSPFSKGKEVSHFISSPKALKNHLGYSSYPSSSDSSGSGSSSSYSYSSDSFPSSSSILSSLKSVGRGWGWGSKPRPGWGSGWSWGKPPAYEVSIHDKGSIIGDFLDAALFIKVAMLKSMFLVAATGTAATVAGVTGIALLLTKLWIIRHGFGVCGIVTALPFCPCAIKSYCAPYRCRIFGGLGGPGCWGGGFGGFGFGFPFGSPFGC